MKSKRLKIFMATLMTIFNLFVCFSSAFAWFVGTKILDGNNIGVQMEATELRIDYSLYAYNDGLKQVEEVSAFNLLPYDTVIKENNEFTPIVMKITLYSSLFTESSADINVLMRCTEDSYNAPVLSNITCFKFGDANVTSNEASDIYYQVLDDLSSATKRTFFTTTKLTSVEYVINLPVDDSKVVFYGIFNYDEDLITSMGLSFDNAPTFTNDIQYIRYSTHE